MGPNATSAINWAKLRKDFPILDQEINGHPLIYFDKSGPQTLRVQAREDGISIDQIVLSAEKYLTKPPGAARADATILPKTP